MKKIILFSLFLYINHIAWSQWQITGNTGINPSINYLGTNDNNDVVFRRWGGRAGLLNPNNTSFGVGALNPSGTGNYNTAIGVTTLGSLTTGIFNTGTGFNTLIYNSTGSFNTAHGAGGLFFNTTGDGNVSSGFNALFHNTTGSYNTASGHEVLMQNTSGNFNTAYGYAAGGDVVTGGNNTFIGSNTGRGITTGSSNTIIGSNVAGLSPSLSNTIILADGSGNQRLYVDNTGKVRIGAPALTLPGTYKLYVEDGILTEKLKVAIKTSADWSDYVFDDNYPLKPLAEVKAFVQQHKHLPGVPSASDMVNTGLDVAEMNARLLEKIEEATLYIIQLNERVEKLEKENIALKKNRRR